MIKIFYTLLVAFNALSVYNVLLNKSDAVPSPTSYLCIFFLLLIECISIIIVVVKYKSTFANKTNFLILLWVLYAVFVILITTNDVFLDIRSALWWPLVYLVFYAIVKNDSTLKCFNTTIKIVVPILFASSLILFFILRKLTLLNDMGNLKEVLVAENSIFYIVTVLPCLCLLRLKYKYPIIFLSLLATLYSFKRSAILCVCIVIVISLYFDFWQNKKASVLKTRFLAILISILLLTIWGFVNKYTDSFIADRFENVKEDRGSGRLDIWAEVLNLYSNQDIVAKINGSGYDSVIKYYKFSAHNDFIEMLFDFGVVGLVLYLIIVVQFAQLCKQSKKLGNVYFASSLSAIVIFILMSSFSHLWLYPSYNAYIMMYFGMINALLSNTISTRSDNQKCLSDENIKSFTKQVAIR